MEQADSTRKGKRTRAPMARMPHDITVEDRQRAVTAMLTTNRDHPLSARSIEAARKAIGIPVHHETLRTWLKEYRAIVEATLPTKPPEQVILEQRDDTLAKLAEARNLALDQITNKEKAKAASYRDSAVVFGITDDHIQTAMGMSPEKVRAWQEYEHTCSLLTMDAMDAFQDYHTWLKSRLPSLQSIARDAQQQQDTDDNTPTLPSGE